MCTRVANALGRHAPCPSPRPQEKEERKAELKRRRSEFRELLERSK